MLIITGLVFVNIQEIKLYTFLLDLIVSHFHFYDNYFIFFEVRKAVKSLLFIPPIPMISNDFFYLPIKNNFIIHSNGKGYVVLTVGQIILLVTLIKITVHTSKQNSI